MRKYVIGIIIGASLMFAVQAGAATLFGTVDGVIQVKVDGENMGQAPVIDGVSYLPVRKLGEKAGYKVEFGEGIATLTKSEPVTTPMASSTVDVGSYTLVTVNEAIEMTTVNIQELEDDIKASEFRGNVENTNALKERLVQRKSHLDKLKEIKVKLETK